MRKVRLVRARYFIWAIVPLAAYGFYSAEGLPHVILSYQWQAAGNISHADFSQRRYTRCTYAGPYGSITESPSTGTCAWVRFAKAKEAR